MNTKTGRDGWILAETVLAALIGSLTISASIMLTRSSDNMARVARERADAVVVAQSLIERARAGDPLAPNTGETPDGRFTWVIIRKEARTETVWRPRVIDLRVTVTPLADPVRQVSLETRVLKGGP